jgi:hypothetical protein
MNTNWLLSMFAFVMYSIICWALMSCGDEEPIKLPGECLALESAHDECDTVGGTWMVQIYEGRTYIFYCKFPEE